MEKEIKRINEAEDKHIIEHFGNDNTTLYLNERKDYESITFHNVKINTIKRITKHYKTDNNRHFTTVVIEAYNKNGKRIAITLDSELFDNEKKVN